MQSSLLDLLKPFDQTKSLYKEVAQVLHQLSLNYPKGAFVLFGSRTKNLAHKYSDWDIGVYGDSLSFKKYLELLDIKDNLTDHLSVTVDLVNLANADSYFIKSNQDKFIFLSGNKKAWGLFLRECDGK